MIETYELLIDTLKAYRNRFDGGVDAWFRLPDEIKTLLNEKHQIAPANVSPVLLKKILATKAREQDPRFIVDENAKRVIEKLVTWLIDRPMSGSVPKGVMIMGKVGCGKTTIIKALKDLCRWFVSDFDHTLNLAYVPSYLIVDGYNTQGAAVFDSTIKVGSEYTNTTNGSLIIDDLGAETLGSHFGKMENVIEGVILRRYDNRSLTFATTNLAQSQIAEFYGPRAWSRMTEMFLFLEYKGNDRRQ